MTAKEEARAAKRVEKFTDALQALMEKHTPPDIFEILLTYAPPEVFEMVALFVTNMNVNYMRWICERIYEVDEEAMLAEEEEDEE